MPMDDKSTQVKDDGRKVKEITFTKGASSKTLNFLKMFARTYQAQSSIVTTENVTCMN